MTSAPGHHPTEPMLAIHSATSVLMFATSVYGRSAENRQIVESALARLTELCASQCVVEMGLDLTPYTRAIAVGSEWLETP